MRLEHLLTHTACQWPEKTALIAGNQRLSYREIETRTTHLARGMRALGLERGDRVALFLENRPEVVLGLYGILKAGGVFLVLNPTMKEDKLAYIFNNARVRGVVTQARLLPLVSAVADRCPSLEWVLTADGRSPAQEEEDLEVPLLWLQEAEALGGREVVSFSPGISLDLAALIYTSGSTGVPKGVMMTHQNMVAAVRAITTYLENTPDDVILNVLPLSFDYGLYQVLMAFAFGGTVVLERSFAYPHRVLETLVRERVTGFPLVPTLSAMLLQMDLSRYDLSSLRYITNTGAHFPTEHIRRWRQLLPWVRIYSMYGLTECKRVSYLPPEEVDRRPDSVGIPMPDTEVWIEDEAGRRLGPGEIGELVVRGPTVMKGYWEMPEETRKVLRPGPLPGEWVLRTGDLFRMDEEGYLYFVARKDDIIKTRGEKVSPREVENVLYALEGVAEAAVVGVPDATLGQAIKAVVVPRDGVRLTAQEILAHCRRHLEDYMVPRWVEIREALPKTATGKIRKSPLRAEAALAQGAREQGQR